MSNLSIQSTSSSGTRPTFKPRSIVWNFFKFPTDSSKTTVTCPACKLDLKYSGSTSGILNHLTARHVDEYKKLLNDKKSKKAAVESREDADIELAKCFATSLTPFRFAENPEFRRFIETKPADFVMPSAKKVKMIIDNLAVVHMEKTRDELEGVESFTILTDGYSDLRRNYHFYSLHVAYIDSNFEKKVQFLTVRKIEKGDHLAISKILNDALLDFGKRFSECSLLMSDAGSPLVLLAEKQGIDRIHCGCHLLNLIITDFAKDKVVQKYQCKMQAFARYLSKNKDTKTKLRSLSDKDNVTDPLPLPLSPTRWGALHMLIDRFLAHYNSAKDLSDLKDFLLRSEELSVLKELSTLLEPIHSGILRLERDHSFVSEIVPTILFIQKQIEKSTSSFAPKMLKAVNNRLKASLGNDRILCVMLLDHRFAYVDSYNSLIDWNDVEKKASKYDLSTDSLTLAATDDDDDIADLDSFLDVSMTSQADRLNGFETELSSYRSLLRSNRPAYKDPLMFWKGQADNFPKLTEMAKLMLASPASASCSERTFSRCSDIIRQKKRNRASVETINNLLVVNELSRLERTSNVSKEREESDDELDSSSESSDESVIEDEEKENEFDDDGMQ